MTHASTIASPGACVWLGVRASSGDVLSKLLPLLLVAAVIVLIGGVVISLARRRLLDASKARPGAVELEGLRALRDQGAITAQEYETARDALIGRVSGASGGAKLPKRRVGPEGELTAQPGFDLTGERLPDARPDGGGGDNDEPDDDHAGPAGVPA